MPSDPDRAPAFFECLLLGVVGDDLVQGRRPEPIAPMEFEATAKPIKRLNYKYKYKYK